jgi:hypothetical protein
LLNERIKTSKYIIDFLKVPPEFFEGDLEEECESSSDDEKNINLNLSKDIKL